MSGDGAGAGGGATGFGGNGASANSAGVAGVPGGLGPSTSASAVGGQVGPSGNAPADTSFGGVSATAGILGALSSTTAVNNGIASLAVEAAQNSTMGLALEGLAAASRSLGVPEAQSANATANDAVGNAPAGGGGQGEGNAVGGDAAPEVVEPPTIVTQPATERQSSAVVGPTPFPTPAPVEAPEIEDGTSAEDEETERLRRARRFFGLAGTNVTGPLGLQAPAPVFRPHASPVLAAKRNLGG